MSATRDKARSVLLLPDPPTLPLPLPAELVETAGFEAIVPACVTSVTARQLTAHPGARDLGLRAYAGIDDATHRGTDVSAKVLVRLFSLPGADGAPLVVKVCGLRLLLPEGAAPLGPDYTPGGVGRRSFVAVCRAVPAPAGGWAVDDWAALRVYADGELCALLPQKAD